MHVIVSSKSEFFVDIKFCLCQLKN